MGIIQSLFSKGKFSIPKSEYDTIIQYFEAMENGEEITDSLNAAMRDLSPTAQRIASDIDSGTASLEDFRASVSGSSASTALATAGMAALNAAISALIAFGIQKLVGWLNEQVHAEKLAAEAAKQAAEESAKVRDKNIEEAESLDKLIAQYKKLATSDQRDASTNEEIAGIQENIADLVGAQASNLDLVNGKLNDELGKLNEIKAAQNAITVDSAVAAFHSAREASKAAMGSESMGFVDGYDFVIPAEERLDEITKVLYEADNRFAQALQSSVFGDKIGLNISGARGDLLGLEDAEDKLEFIHEMMDTLKSGLDDYASTDFYTALVKAAAFYEQFVNDETAAAQQILDSVIDGYNKDGIMDQAVTTAEEYIANRDKIVDDISNNNNDISAAIAEGFIDRDDIEQAVNEQLATLENYSEGYAAWAESMREQTQTMIPESEKISFGDLIADEDFKKKVDEYTDKMSEYRQALDDFRSGDTSEAELRVQFPELSADADIETGLAKQMLDQTQQMNNEFENQARLLKDEDLPALHTFEDSVFAVGSGAADATEKISKFNSEMEEVGKAADLLKSADEEIEKYGKSSLDTLQSLQELMGMGLGKLLCHVKRSLRHNIQPLQNRK